MTLFGKIKEVGVDCILSVHTIFTCASEETAYVKANIFKGEIIGAFLLVIVQEMLYSTRLKFKK